MSHVVLIGEGDLAEEVRRALDDEGEDVYRLKAPGELEMKRALEVDGIDRVLIVFRDDAVALRMALMVRSLDDELPMLVTIFDPTIARQVKDSIEHCDVTSMADIVAPSLAGPCLGEDLEEVHEGDPVDVPKRRRFRALSRAILTPYDKSAGLLLWGALGLLIILLIETVASMFALDQGVIDAAYGSAKTLVTVDPNDEVADGPKWLKAFLTVSMLTALVFEAGFTAGLVNRLIDRRLTGLWGRRAVPRRDHVVVVGMGQVGLRLCILLRDLGVGVVAVDDRQEGENVGKARELGLPVVVGRGADPSILRRLSLHRALAIAAVTDDDLQNLSIAMAAKSVDEDVRIVLRAGDGRIANETRSLFRIGVVRDVHQIAACELAARASKARAGEAAARGALPADAPDVLRR